MEHESFTADGILIIIVRLAIRGRQAVVHDGVECWYYI